MPAKHDSTRSKADALLDEGTLNPAPEKIRDPKFREGEFFDPRDAVQVKYEMLRRVSGRERVGDGCFRRIRCLKADLLPGQVELRRSRHCGVGAQEARPAWSAQDPRRSVGVSQEAVRSGRADPGARAGAVDPPRIRPRCASEDDRARGRWKKNFQVMSEPAAECSSRLSTVLAQYEILRMTTFGEALAPESRSGLALFLRRGMWGWMRALDAASARPVPIPAAPSGLTESCDRSVVIHAFAAIAMKVTNRRAP